MPRGKRHRIATNIYRDHAGISGFVRGGGKRVEMRFPAGTSVPEIRNALQNKQRRLEQALPLAFGKGTLADVIQTAIDKLPEGRYRTEREDLLQPWVIAKGASRWHDLTRVELQAVADQWQAGGLSASRLNKRISALRVAWRSVAPDDALLHPVERLHRYREPRAETVRAIPLSLVQEVIDQVQDRRDVKGLSQFCDNAPLSKSKARLMVLAWTGQPPARIMAIRPEHVKWDTTPPELYVVPRRKGAGSHDAWLPLLPQAVSALRLFFAAGAQGRFELAPLGRVLKRAVRRLQANLRRKGRPVDADRLESLRIYDLRHSFLTALASETQDAYAVAEYAGHASIQTTRRYLRGAASPRMKASLDQLAKILPAVPVERAAAGGRKRERKRAKASSRA